MVAITTDAQNRVKRQNVSVFYIANNMFDSFQFCIFSRLIVD